MTVTGPRQISPDRIWRVMRGIVRAVLFVAFATAMAVILVEERRQTCFARAAAIATSDAVTGQRVGRGGSVTVKYIGPGVQKAKAGGRTLRLPGNFEHTLTCR